MIDIEIFQLPPEPYAYLQVILPERQRVFYVKYITDKIGMFVPAKGKTVEWQLGNPAGGLTLADMLRQGRNLILSTTSLPLGGLVRFDIGRAAASIFTPNPNFLSLWSYSIQQDEKRRIWSAATARSNPLMQVSPPADYPTLARSELSKHGGVTDYWVLPAELAYPHQLKYDKKGRLWFSLDLVSGWGKHQFAVFDPVKNQVTGYTINEIGAAGIADIAVDNQNESIWLTHRHPSEVYRFNWNSNEVDVYENPSVSAPNRNDLLPNTAPVFLSRDGHINTLDIARVTARRKVISSRYNVIKQRTELRASALGVSETKSSVPRSKVSEPTTYAGPFMRWPTPALVGLPAGYDIKTQGSYVYFSESGDSLLCRFRI